MEKSEAINLRIIKECFQPKIGRKIRIFILGRKNKKEHSYKKGKVYLATRPTK